MSAKQLRNCKDKVEFLLKTIKETKENDTVLWLEYMCEHHGLIGAIGIDAFLNLTRFLTQKEVPSHETLGRIRRKFQEQGLYRSTNYDARQSEQILVQQELGYDV